MPCAGHLTCWAPNVLPLCSGTAREEIWRLLCLQGRLAAGCRHSCLHLAEEETFFPSVTRQEPLFSYFSALFREGMLWGIPRRWLMLPQSGKSGVGYSLAPFPCAFLSKHLANYTH